MTGRAQSPETFGGYRSSFFTPGHEKYSTGPELEELLQKYDIQLISWRDIANLAPTR